MDDEGEEGREEETQGKGEGEERDASALYGSHGPKFGGGCELLYTQFELQSPVAKRHQIVLLKVIPCIIIVYILSIWQMLCVYCKYDTCVGVFQLGLHVSDCGDVQQRV